MPQSECLQLYATVLPKFVSSTANERAYLNLYNCKAMLKKEESQRVVGSAMDNLSQAIEQIHLKDANDNFASPKRSPTKKVTFADSVGLELENIRHITAGRDTPPFLDPSLTAINNQSEKQLTKTLTMDFKQPIADYIVFRERLNKICVSLESVSVTGCTVIGTIKVRNIDYYKNVFIRVTSNNWKSMEDHQAYYVNTGLSSSTPGITSTLDTFSFQFDVSLQEVTSIQFAVCFRCSNGEFWDNNNGQNYIIKVRSDDSSCSSSEHSGSALWHSVFNHHDDECDWTQFAAWKRADNSVPYW